MREHDEQESDAPEGEKKPMQVQLKELAERARARHRKRSATPEVRVTGDLYQEGWRFSSPYPDEDEDDWVALLFDAFGTRSNAVFVTFTTQLSRLCGVQFDSDAKQSRPDEYELVTAVQIVRSLKPRNEAEACLAAQMVAVHMATMKLGAQIGSMTYPDERTVSVMGKLGRTYAMQMETMTKLKGKRPTTRQNITVRKYAQHEHKHVHIHQGGLENGNQPQGPRNGRNLSITGGDAPLEHEGSPSLLGQDEGGDALPMPCKEGEDEVPHSRWGSGKRSPGRRTERGLQDGGMDP